MHGITEHEDTQGVSLGAFVAHYLAEYGHNASVGLLSVQASLKATVNHGRWIVDCPTPGCNGALVASSKEPWFLCPYCANRSNQGHPYRVIFPQDKAEIETLLTKRPALANRNWLPQETKMDLRRENEARGIV